MSAPRLAPTAFPLEYIHSLPTIQDLVKNVQTCKRAKDSAGNNVEADDDTDDFVLVDAAETTGTVTAIAKMSDMSIDEPPRPSPFIDMLIHEEQENAALGRTENNAVTYSTSLHPLVDLFYAVKEKSQSRLIRQHLASAWNVDPLKALKLVFFLRDVRDGKGCNEEFYTAAQWLLKSHPETFKYNVVQFCPRFGYWKDLLELLVRECLGEEGYAKERQEALRNKTVFSPDLRAKRDQAARLRHAQQKAPRSRLRRRSPISVLHATIKTSALREKKARSKVRRAAYAKMTPEEAAKAKAEFAMEVEEKQQELKEQIKQERLDKRDNAIVQARAVWNARKDWRDFHIAVAKQFAVALHLDKLRLDAKKNVSSLCAKWAPTADHYHDKHTCIAATVALILFPLAAHRQENESEDKYISRALRMYQSSYLTPLREAAHITESLMSAGKWDSINYSHVPAISFNRNKAGFKEHDTERFTQHVMDAATGKQGKKIQASTLKPHEIVGKFLHLGGYNYLIEDVPDELEAQVTEAQWLNYVETIQKAGSLDNCIAIADVSGSMSGLPIQCSIALSLLVATAAKPPFNKAFITFHKTPSLVILPDHANTLRKKVEFVAKLDWGLNTNFQAVFDLLLKKAKKHHLPKKDMIKTLFVFSDMQFDSACYGDTDSFETDYKQIQRKFGKAGYDVPKIIFWNLRESMASGTPVLYDNIGTAMVSGWSGQLLKLFMENGGDMVNSPEFSPEFVMNKAIGKASYDILKVID
jgi:Domain of unknown function (DUF2828)